ncbi:MAG TPA: MaoC family dehydratase N-terminal domain-containing protein [Limnochordales bacterium]
MSPANENREQPLREEVPAQPADGPGQVAATGQSLVPPEAWKLVGKQIGPGKPLTIYANDVERFCKVIGEDNPIFFDDEVARKSPYGGRPMPLPFPLTRFESGDERSFHVPLRATRRVRGEDELVVLRPIKVGDEIRARTRLVDMEEKTGRSGRMVFLRFETEYLLDNDEVAMIVRTTIVRR